MWVCMYTYETNFGMSVWVNVGNRRSRKVQIEFYPVEMKRNGFRI